ncbi:hypothetical protein [Embleya sp. AB8]|uniref:hypothetical protein n=1 Tax=Embleya sp. AB8 TaxID=3156304 RepID=UPI003C760E87
MPGQHDPGVQCRALVSVENGWCAAHRPVDAGPAPVSVPPSSRRTGKALQEYRERIRATVACPHCDAAVGDPSDGIDGTARVSNHNERRHVALRGDTPATTPTVAKDVSESPLEHPADAAEGDTTVAQVIEQRGVVFAKRADGWSDTEPIAPRLP